MQSRSNWAEIHESFEYVTVDGEPVNLMPEACLLMAKLIWSAVEKVVVKAFAAMEWMQECARTLHAHNIPTQWVVPVTGFPVKQEYWEWIKRQVKTQIAGGIVQPVIYHDGTNTDWRRQMNGVSPNVIHSLDSAVMMLTVTDSAADGVTEFLMVHDSFATVAGDAAILARNTRGAFAALFGQRNVPMEIWSQWQALLPEGVELRKPPEQGTLDVSDVMNSDYFFS